MTVQRIDHDALLELNDVSVSLGISSFGPFSLKVNPGERIAILGPSGAGKSTLLKIMARELPAQNGRVHLDGCPLTSWSLTQLSRRRAMLPQSSDVAFGLLTDLVISLGRVALNEDPDLAEIVEQAANLACATHLLGRRFDTLSGGEQARVQLARIFAQLWDVKEGLILIDEPLAALDPGLQFEILESLDMYASQRCHAMIAILHDINHALLGFDRLLLVKSGRLVGDLPGNINAISMLESLYDIVLSCMTDMHGNLIVSSQRKSNRSRVVA